MTKNEAESQKTETRARRIGLMGGTFDPIHFGHLFIAEAARAACALDEVIFFPNGTPAHAEGKVASLSGEMRLELLEIALAGNAHFRASRIELERPGKSFAFDTIQQFQRELGADAQLFFIVGADSMCDILTWYRGAELFELCHFVAASRPGFELEEAQTRLTAAQRAQTTWLHVPGLHIASRELRARVQNDLPIRYLVPDAVVARISELNHYKERGIS
ncbi:nicotinate-nucleotide adenylyltransferase [Abditibacterium utsteinense]|uniref:Probable nicotinate-nucleotide adenylyltransferase n=1 Tax=Abditibacterium utsteinense TaxID=1960156 RepID=A0A2S8SUF7_9BACT|nr:nicotinate-nucleotide adenylyltransferase [Abditibacterium utsteinense]PQV64431.1 nicotinate-nucleotide adenylyltransferase [Abditibacterium utsteinense]